jgi:putative FmdB family regulatory protein
VPTYQYRCTECGSDLEAVQSFSDAALTECPSCSGRLRKVFGSVGLVFKGTGFYKTDSRSGSTGGAKDRDKKTSEKAASSESEKAASSASESPAAASPGTPPEKKSAGSQPVAA